MDSQGALFVDDGLCVEPIRAKEAYPYLLNIHYAGRIPSISYAYGLYVGGELCGVVTYGKPPAAPQRTGVCGKHFADRVLELNRLCLLYNRKNEASQIVSRSLKMLPRPSIVISYADPSEGHEGYIYQATNFIYCGLTEKRSEWKIKGMEHLHSQTIADKFRHEDSPSKAIRAAHGDDFYLKDRPRKHRYIFFLGSKTEKKKMKEALNYKIKAYPKHITDKGRRELG